MIDLDLTDYLVYPVLNGVEFKDCGKLIALDEGSQRNNSIPSLKKILVGSNGYICDYMKINEIENTIGIIENKYLNNLFNSNNYLENQSKMLGKLNNKLSDTAIAIMILVESGIIPHHNFKKQFIFIAEGQNLDHNKLNKFRNRFKQRVKKQFIDKSIAVTVKEFKNNHKELLGRKLY